MKIQELTKNNPKELCIECQEILKTEGNVLLIPTETVYGLACNWTDEKAREHIYQLKQREGHKPLQMLVHHVDAVKQFDLVESELLWKLCDAFCPGPITIIVSLKNKTEKIGFRVPDHPFVLELLKLTGQPLAATSANASGEPPCLTVHDALEQFTGSPELVIDEGEIHPSSQASTVVEVTAENYNILREGPITKEDIEKVKNG